MRQRESEMLSPSPSTIKDREATHTGAVPVSTDLRSACNCIATHTSGKQKETEKKRRQRLSHWRARQRSRPRVSEGMHCFHCDPEDGAVKSTGVSPSDGTVRATTGLARIFYLKNPTPPGAAKATYCDDMLNNIMFITISATAVETRKLKVKRPN